MAKKTFEQRVSAVLNGLRDNGTYSVAKVIKLGGSIGTRAANLDVDMHSAGVAALGCAMDHNDTTAAVKIINSLGRHTRAKAFATWCEKYSDITLNLNKKTGLWTGKLLAKEDRRDAQKLAELLAEALADPFWSPPEKSSRDFSLALALAHLLKRAETAKAKGTLSGDDLVALVDIQEVAERVAPKTPEKATEPAGDVLENAG